MPGASEVGGFGGGASRVSPTGASGAVSIAARAAAERPDWGQVNEGVVRDQSDRKVHDHENSYCLRGFALYEDVKVRKPEHKGHQNCHSKKHPTWRGRNPRHNRPRRASDHDADDGEFGVVRE